MTSKFCFCKNTIKRVEVLATKPGNMNLTPNTRMMERESYSHSCSLTSK